MNRWGLFLSKYSGRVRETKRFPDWNPQAAWQFADKPAQRAAATQCQYFRRGKLGVSRFTVGTHQFILLFYQVEIPISTYSNVFLCSSADRGER